MGIIVLLIFSSLLFFLNINSFPLRNWDEAWYGEIVKNITSHNTLVPFWNGQYYFDKPPLYFWLTIPLVKFFGLGEWQVRFVSNLFAVLSVLLIYLLGKRLFNSRVGLLSATIFLSLGQVYMRLSRGNLDALLICFFLSTFYFYLLSEKKKLFAVVCGIFLGLGFLIKGWSVGLFPLFVIIAYSVVVEKRIMLINMLLE